MDADAYAKHNKPENGAPVGVYKHPDVAEELHCTSHPMADAVVRQGWVYARPLPKPEDARQEALKKDKEADAKASAPVEAPKEGKK